MDEGDFQLFSRQNNSDFVTFEKSSGSHSIKDDSEVVYTKGNQEGTLEIRYDDIGMKKKVILTRFGSTFGKLRFDEKPCF